MAFSVLNLTVMGTSFVARHRRAENDGPENDCECDLADSSIATSVEALN